MRARITIGVALLLLVAACSDATQEAPDAGAPGPADLATVLEPIRLEWDLPSLSAAVISADGTIALGAVGVRKLGDPTAVTNDDKHHLGSCTKAMTAVLVALLAEDGAISWDTTVESLLPEAAPDMRAEYRALTLPAFLTHMSGIGDAAQHPDIWSELWTSTAPTTELRAWFAAEVLARAPLAPPGTQFSYSNFGYMVVGAALERATGQSWEQLVSERIFVPRAMSSCGFGPPATPGEVDEPWGHTEDGPVDPGDLVADNPPALGPAGTVHCALEDWAKFVRVFMNDGTDFLSAESLTRLTTPPPGQEYAAGWAVVDRDWAGGTAYNHTGSNTMFFVNAWVAPARDRALLIATNGAGDDAFFATDATVAALIESYLP